MSQSASIKAGKADQTRWLECKSCKRNTQHRCWFSVTEGEDPGDGIWYVQEYMIVECNGCKTVSFAIEQSNSEDMEEDESGRWSRAYSHVRYPSVVPNRPAMNNVHDLPVRIHSVYLETLTAASNGQPVLTGIGIRAIVESVCNNRKAKGGNLYDKIDDLIQKQLITKSDAKILHSLRFMGNTAAHEAKAHNTDELSLAIGVVEHLLQGVYILPLQAKSLPKERKKRKKAKAPSATPTKKKTP